MSPSLISMLFFATLFALLVFNRVAMRGSGRVPINPDPPPVTLKKIYSNEELQDARRYQSRPGGSILDPTKVTK